MVIRSFYSDAYVVGIRTLLALGGSALETKIAEEGMITQREIQTMFAKLQKDGLIQRSGKYDGMVDVTGAKEKIDVDEYEKQRLQDLKDKKNGIAPQRRKRDKKDCVWTIDFDLFVRTVRYRFNKMHEQLNVKMDEEEMFVCPNERCPRNGREYTTMDLLDYQALMGIDDKVFRCPEPGCVVMEEKEVVSKTGAVHTVDVRMNTPLRSTSEGSGPRGLRERYNAEMKPLFDQLRKAEMEAAEALKVRAKLTDSGKIGLEAEEAQRRALNNIEAKIEVEIEGAATKKKKKGPLLVNTANLPWLKRQHQSDGSLNHARKLEEIEKEKRKREAEAKKKEEEEEKNEEDAEEIGGTKRVKLGGISADTFHIDDSIASSKKEDLDDMVLEDFAMEDEVGFSTTELQLPDEDDGGDIETPLNTDMKTPIGTDTPSASTLEGPDSSGPQVDTEVTTSGETKTENEEEKEENYVFGDTAGDADGMEWEGDLDMGEEDGEPMTMTVAGVPKLFMDLTEEDLEQMTPEEYSHYTEVVATLDV